MSLKREISSKLERSLKCKMLRKIAEPNEIVSQNLLRRFQLF